MYDIDKISKIILIVALFTLISFISLNLVGFASAQNVNIQSPTVCCEKTKSGLFCQNVPSSECESGSQQAPTSCEATSYCKSGICFDSNEGTCLDNTPQNVCNQNGGIWKEGPVPQCELGCCVIGDQAAFVTLTRCKKLSSVLGLETNYKKEITNEVACISSVLGQEKGACVFESELQKTCRMTTRADCSSAIKGEFFKNILCSAEELGTNCGPTEKTACLPGKEEVYFVDSCGNSANIYDATKINDKDYWTNIKTKSESCNPNSINANSKTCGNCNYISGSFCRKASTGNKPTYGNNACADLNCYDTSNGKDYKHGESWCINSGEPNSAGGRFYKHICANGEEVLEACDDFKQQVCIEGKISYNIGNKAETFSQAGCTVNRWIDCAMQNIESDCLNSDQRDCTWLGSTGTGGATGLMCVPKIAPGLQFWQGTDAKSVCAVANAQCTVKSEKGLTGQGWKITSGGDCVTNEGKDISNVWRNSMMQRCSALGDCGIKNNWAGTAGGLDLNKMLSKTRVSDGE